MRRISFTGIMARRLLVNWRIDPAAAARALPPALRPSLVSGFAVAGLCLVRLERLRPVGLPALLGLASENIAIRMGVEWNSPRGVQQSVFIFRRESPSRVNGALCHLIGYGVHHHGAIMASDSPRQTHIEMTSDTHSLHARVRPIDRIRCNSVFTSMDRAESFFRGSECGYSPTTRPGLFDGVRLCLNRWDMQPMAIDSASSTFLESLFPGATLDSAFVMRNIEHTWSPCGREAFGVLPPVAALPHNALAA